VEPSSGDLSAGELLPLTRNLLRPVETAVYRPSSRTSRIYDLLRTIDTEAPGRQIVSEDGAA
jgi:hypothetical protein